MKPSGYRVIFQRIQQGKDIRAVKQDLADAFHSTPEKMEILLSKLPVVLKENVDHASAMKYQKAILKAGGDCRVEPLGESVSGASDSAAAPSESAPPLKICPKCGYEATSSGDPLLTAHQGRGECPACGIILAKFHRGEARQADGTERPAVAEPGRPSISLDKSRHTVSFSLKMLFIGLIFIAGIVYYSMSGNGPSTNPQPVRQAQLKENRSAGRASDPSRITAGEMIAENKRSEKKSLRILPGERKVFTISCYLPIFHDDQSGPVDLDPHWKVNANTWKEMGVEAEVSGAKIEPDSASIWEVRQEGAELWRPVRANLNMHFDRKFRVLFKDDNPFKNVKFLNCGSVGVSELKKFSAMPRESVAEVVKQYLPGSPELRKGQYYLYRTDLEISIRLPAGNEFGARELKRIGQGGKEEKVWGREGELMWEVFGFIAKHASAGIELHPLTADFKMVHEAHKEGIIVKLDPNSMMPDWEIHE